MKKLNPMAAVIAVLSFVIFRETLGYVDGLEAWFKVFLDAMWLCSFYYIPLWIMEEKERSKPYESWEDYIKRTS